jgi:glutamate decarboxylase
LSGSSQDSVHLTGGRYGSRYGSDSVPKYRIPPKGVDEETAYQIIHDELSLDGSPLLNLASFVQTWMPAIADKLMLENISKNLIDQDEYPVTQDIHTRCISILSGLWHAPSHHHAVGTATTGSSEAIQLGGLAMKRIWQAKRKAAGKSIHEPGPNIIMGANAQVALEKFARYFEVEMRLVPISVESKYRLDPKKAMEYVDENTIGVYVILGSTYTGHYEPVKEMADLLDEYEKRTGHSVPIHVDGASGGFVAPFANPKLEWDFKIPRVVSINTSGHKFGLAYVGVGWVIWRSAEYLPKDLIFELHYLGSVEYSFSLNFSRPAHPIIAQYFNFLSLGFEGYRNVALADLKNARTLSRALERSGYFTVLSDIHRHVGGSGDIATRSANEGDIESYEPGLPVVAFRFSDDFQKKYPDIKQKWIQTLLRAKGWIVPNYDLAPDLSQIDILRVVVKENFVEALLDRLVADIVEITEDLVKQDSPTHTLSTLGKRTSGPSSHEKVHGRVEKHEVEGVPEHSGTYTKPC